MGDSPQLAFLYPSGGMNGSGVSSRLPDSQYRRATNVALVDEMPTTRAGVVIHELEGDVAELNVQGVSFFNPGKGQDGLNRYESTPQILIAAGGRKFSVKVRGGSTAAAVTVKDISGLVRSDPKYHLVWWSTAENYAFAQDGIGDCFIWDGTTATLSKGYDTVDKPSSMVPNGGTVMLYVHARLVVVVNGKFILAGDSLHKSNLTNASNLLQFTEQVYYFTGAFFLPPSSMGNIMAAAVLPIRDTNDGQSDAVFHCESGIFSVELNVFPRSDWPVKALVKHTLAKPGAAGPYAIAARAGDQIYRATDGIATLRSARAQDDLEGEPAAPYSEPVKTFLAVDVPEWLRFASVNMWDKGGRLLCTVDPTVDGRFRWHAGLVVRNFNPRPAERTAACWEGLWTLPAEAAGIVQLVSGSFEGEERQFAVCRGQDGKNRLVEFIPHLREDVLANGDRQAIRCQLLSRAVDFSAPFVDKGLTTGTLFVRNARGNSEWAVWARVLGSSKFIFWRGGTIAVSDAAGESGLEEAEPFTGEIPLGAFPKECATRNGSARSVEFLIRWKGYLQIESLRIMATKDDDRTEKLDIDKFTILVKDPIAGGYSDYEYSGGAEWQIEATP